MGSKASMRINSHSQRFAKTGVCLLGVIQLSAAIQLQLTTNFTQSKASLRLVLDSKRFAQTVKCLLGDCLGDPIFGGDAAQIQHELTEIRASRDIFTVKMVHAFFGHE